MVGNESDRAAQSFRLSQPGAISQAIAAAEGFAVGCGCDGDLRTRLLVIVEELVANLIDHGSAAGAPVWLDLSRQPCGILLVLRDEGTPFDPRDASPAEDLPPERGGGAGLALVRAWSRLLSYRREDGINRLVLLIPHRSEA